jgi:hypothetical protein
MSWLEVVIDFEMNACQAQAAIDLLDQQFDLGIYLSVVMDNFVRLYVTFRRHAPFLKTVDGQDVELRVGGQRLMAKVYFPISTAPLI